MDDLSKSAKRVQDFMTDKGFEFEVNELPSSTRTAQEAAESVGCTIEQIAKSLVFRDRDTNHPVLIIASGGNRVDLKKVKEKTGLKLGKADGDFVKKNVGFAIGGIPPVAHNTPLRTILDQDLLNYDDIWAAAGTPFAVFKLKPGDLEPMTKGAWLDLAQLKKPEK